MRPSIYPVKYEKLSELHTPRDSDELTAMNSPLQPPFERPCGYHIFLAGIAFTVLVGLSVAQLILAATHHPSHEPFRIPAIQKQPCGKSVADAKDRGCHYSFSLGAWLPPECIDFELEAQFEREGDFTFYFKNATGDGPDMSRRVATIKDLSEFAHEDHQWASWRYHVQHCFAAWIYVHKAAMNGGMVSSQIAGLEHTLHCTDISLDEDIGMDDVVTEAINDWPDCVPVAYTGKNIHFQR